MSMWSLTWHSTNKSVTAAPYRIESYSLSHSWTPWWRVRWLKHAVPSWGRGGTAAAMMAQNSSANQNVHNSSKTSSKLLVTVTRLLPWKRTVYQRLRMESVDVSVLTPDCWERHIRHERSLSNHNASMQHPQTLNTECHHATSATIRYEMLL